MTPDESSEKREPHVKKPILVTSAAVNEMDLRSTTDEVIRAALNEIRFNSLPEVPRPTRGTPNEACCGAPQHAQS